MTRRKDSKLQKKKAAEEKERAKQEALSKEHPSKNLVASTSNAATRQANTGPAYFEDEQSIKAALSTTFKHTALSGWILVSYSSSSGSGLKLDKQSGGTLNDLLPQLQNDQVQYAIIRIQPDDADAKTRDVFINWVGPGVRALEKGKKKSHLSEVQRILQPFHIAISAFTKSNFTLDTLKRVSDPRTANHSID